MASAEVGSASGPAVAMAYLFGTTGLAAVRNCQRAPLRRTVTFDPAQLLNWPDRTHLPERALRCAAHRPDRLNYTLMVPARVQTFDGFRILLPDNQLTVSSKAAREVLVFMLLRDDGAITRSQLAGTLWPDLPEQRALKRLSQALWRLNSELNAHDVVPPLSAGRDHVEMTSNHGWTLDACEFDEMVGRGASPSPHVALAALSRAVAINRGVMLPGHDAEWLDEQRQEREIALLTVLNRLAELQRTAGNLGEALTHARRRASLDQYRDDAQRFVMELLIDSGRPHEALRWFDRYKERLAVEVGGLPEDATVAVADRARQHILAPVAEAGARAAPFVGRDAERTLLLDLLESLQESGLCTALLFGPAGIGKSRLLTEFTTDAKWRGAIVLSSRATSDPEPFGLLADAINRALTEGHLKSVRSALDPAWLARAGQVLESLHPVEATAAQYQLQASDQRDQTAEAVIGVIAALANSNSVVLALDDIHRADPDSLFLLERLVAAGRNMPLLVCATFRPEDAKKEDAANHTLEKLRSQRGSVDIELGPLDRHAVANLVRAALPRASPELAAEVMATTKGLPLAVVQALRSSSNRDQPHPAKSGGPLALLHSLDEASQRVALDMAVLADPVDLETLERISDLDDSDLIHALDHLLQSGLMAVEKNRYRLYHDLTRESIYEMTPPEKRIRIHARVAAGLREANAARAQVARHLAAAGDSRSAFVAYRSAARESLERNAYEGAERCYRLAAELIEPAAITADETFDLLMEWDDVLSRVGRDADREPLLTRLAKLDATRPDAVAQVMYRRADLAMLLDDYPTAVAQAKGAAERAHDIGNRRLEAMSLARQGRALHESGAHADAEQVLQRAASIAPDPRTESEARRALGRLFIDEARYRDAEQQLTKALYLCRGIGDGGAEAAVCNALGTAMILIGDSARASSYFETAIEKARSLGVLSVEAYALGNSGLQHYYEGRPQSAVSQTMLAAQRCQRLGRLNQEARLRANAGHIQVVLLGDYEAGSTQLRTAMDMFDQVDHPIGRADCLNALARAALRTDDIETAREQATEAVHIARDAGVRFVEVQAMRTLAAVERKAGDTDRAIELLAEGLSICDANELTAVGVLMRGLLGRARLDQGDAEEALIQLRAATAANRGTVEEAHLVDLWHFQAAQAAGFGDEADGALLRAHHKLESIGEDVGDAWEQVIGRVPAYRLITEAFERRLGKKTMFTVRSGRDQMQVPVVTSPTSNGGAAARRQGIVSVFEQLRAVGAAPSVAELAEFFGVSDRTIKRDLAELRRTGHDLPTRGSEANGGA